MTRLHCSGLIFTIKLLPTLGMLLLLTLFINLGVWQLHRAHEKEALQQKISTAAALPPLQWSQLQHAQEHLDYAPAQLKGKYENQLSFLLDNKFYQHKVGYEVVTPFRPSARNAPLILVNRGWVAASPNRQQLPKITPAATHQVIGRLTKPSTNIFVKSTAITAPILQPLASIDFVRLQQALKQPLYPYMILLDSNSPDGFMRDWKFIQVQASKHYGYALQWFALALTLVIIYLNVITRRAQE